MAKDHTAEAAAHDVKEIARYLRSHKRVMGLDDPRGRYISLAITKLEEAELWLTKDPDGE